jgi:sulfate adenylyltransferase subunit 2
MSELNARRRHAVALRLNGHTLARASEEAGLSVPTVVAAVRAWQRGGWPAVDVRPRGRKPVDERALAKEDEARLVAEWSEPACGVWTLRRAVADLCARHPALEALAPTQLEPIVTRLWQGAGLTPPNAWDAWRAVGQGPLAIWQANELPSLRRLCTQSGAKLLALSERTLPAAADPSGRACQLAAHSGRGTAFWRITPAWPTEADWIAFLQALRAEVGHPVWLLTANRWLVRRPLLAQWLADPAHGVVLIHPPEQRPTATEPPTLAPL